MGLRNPLVPQFLWHLQYDPFTCYLVLFWVCKGQTNFGVTNSAATTEVLKLLIFLLVHPPYRLVPCTVPTQIKCPFPSTQKVVSPTPLLIAVLLPCGLLFFQATFPDSLVLPVPRALCQAIPHHSVPCKSTGAMQLPTHPFAWPQSWNSDRDSSILFAFVSWRLANCLRLTVLYKYLKNEHMSNLTVSKL